MAEYPKLLKPQFIMYYFSFLVMAVFLTNANAEKQSYLSRLGDVKHIKLNKPFPYLNANAPKGGSLTLSAVGSFDTLNPFTARGTAPMEALSLTFDRLMYRAPDEPYTQYALIIEHVEIRDDKSEIIAHIHPAAKFNDGEPITSDDVKATFDCLAVHGRPIFKSYIGQIQKFTKISNQTFKLEFKKDKNGTYDPELPLNIMGLSIMPKAFLNDVDFMNTGLKAIPSSGPYRIKKFEIGRYILLEKNPHYWAKDLPQFRGTNNFQTIRIDYYKNQQAQFQAFKSGEFDAYFETNPGAWQRNYNFKAVKDGRVKLISHEHNRPVLRRSITFNLRREKFHAIHLRKALVKAFDFHGLNKLVFGGAMKQAASIFANTYLAHQNSEKDAILKTMADALGPSINMGAFEIYQNNVKQLSRKHYNAILKDLKSAGFHLKAGKLHNRNNTPISFELIVKDEKLEKVALFFKENLKKLGITLNVVRVDSVQYENRVLESNFDMIISPAINSLSPGQEQLYYYGKEFAHKTGSSNFKGVQDDHVETLIKFLLSAKNKAEQTTRAHAFDYYVMNQYWEVPLMYDNAYREARWHNRFDAPEFKPTVGTNIMVWGWAKK